MIAYLLTQPKVTIDRIAAVLSQAFPKTSLSDGVVWLRVQTQDEADFDSVHIQEMSLQNALEEWAADSPLVRELFHNPYLQSSSKPFPVTLRNSRPSNRLFPTVVRCLTEAGIDTVVVGQLGLHLTADDFLRRLDANPSWQWEYETTSGG
jgi:hypothetical protein